MNTRLFSPALLLLAALCLGAWACSPSRPRSVYPPPDTLRMAEPQRREFVHLFLQGRWCEAQGLFARSQEGYLMQDDFCAAAQNHILAWKLHKYVGIDMDHHLDQAHTLLRTGHDCPQVVPPDTGLKHQQPDNLPDKDRGYQNLLDAGRFEDLARRLHAERDQLYASVYGRKAARAAGQSGDTRAAHMLIEQVRALDARQGWIVFLIEDWRIMHDMTEDRDLRAEIEDRVETLRNMIQPCPF